jgi:hypothetical protein
MPPLALTGGCAIPVPLHQASHRDTLPFRHYNAHVETAPYALSMREVL